MHEVAYRATGIHEIDHIRPLWVDLNEYHHARASHFRSHYERTTFEDRRTHFCKLHASGQLRLDLAFDSMTGQCIG